VAAESRIHPASSALSSIPPRTAWAAFSPVDHGVLTSSNDREGEERDTPDVEAADARRGPCRQGAQEHDGQHEERRVERRPEKAVIDLRQVDSLE